MVMLRWEKQLENQFWRIEVSYENAANKFFKYLVAPPICKVFKLCLECEDAWKSVILTTEEW
jgi:hypothetical protein